MRAIPGFATMPSASRPRQLDPDVLPRAEVLPASHALHSVDVPLHPLGAHRIDVELLEVSVRRPRRATSVKAVNRLDVVL